MDTSLGKIVQAQGLLTQALAILDEREFLVEAAFVQSALDRIAETIATFEADPGTAVAPLHKL